MDKEWESMKELRIKFLKHKKRMDEKAEKLYAERAQLEAEKLSTEKDRMETEKQRIVQQAERAKLEEDKAELRSERQAFEKKAASTRRRLKEARKRAGESSPQSDASETSVKITGPDKGQKRVVVLSLSEGSGSESSKESPCSAKGRRKRAFPKKRRRRPRGRQRDPCKCVHQRQSPQSTPDGSCDREKTSGRKKNLIVSWSQEEVYTEDTAGSHTSDIAVERVMLVKSSALANIITVESSEMIVNEVAAQNTLVKARRLWTTPTAHTNGRNPQKVITSPAVSRQRTPVVNENRREHGEPTATPKKAGQLKNATPKMLLLSVLCADLCATTDGESELGDAIIDDYADSSGWEQDEVLEEDTGSYIVAKITRRHEWRRRDPPPAFQPEEKQDPRLARKTSGEIESPPKLPSSKGMETADAGRSGGPTREDTRDDQTGQKPPRARKNTKAQGDVVLQDTASKEVGPTVQELQTKIKMMELERDEMRQQTREMHETLGRVALQQIKANASTEVNVDPIVSVGQEPEKYPSFIRLDTSSGSFHRLISEQDKDPDCFTSDTSLALQNASQNNSAGDEDQSDEGVTTECVHVLEKTEVRRPTRSSSCGASEIEKLLAQREIAKSAEDAERLARLHHAKAEKLRQKLRALKTRQKDTLRRCREECLKIVQREVEQRDNQLEEEKQYQARLKDALLSLQKRVTDMEREEWQAKLERQAREMQVEREKAALEERAKNMEKEAATYKKEKEDAGEMHREQTKTQRYKEKDVKLRKPYQVKEKDSRDSQDKPQPSNRVEFNHDKPETSRQVDKEQGKFPRGEDAELKQDESQLTNEAERKEDKFKHTSEAECQMRSNALKKQSLNQMRPKEPKK
nr:hypothetical protein BaRGS_020048 [Batillaria attramentaria]